MNLNTTEAKRESKALTSNNSASNIVDNKPKRYRKEVERSL